MTGDTPDHSAISRFATYVAALGRGQGRSRPLTRSEARDAMEILLAGEADPMQQGAFLMLLRYRGEDPEEITGLVEAASAACAIQGAQAELDWPSYGAGRTRGEPWFLLAALALAQSGVRVLMHGTNEFSSGFTVGHALERLGLASAATKQDATRLLAQTGFAYVPASVLSPKLDELLGLRRLFGLRSPINTVARLLNPANAQAGVDGVFHPPYIETHLAVAERLRRTRLLVLKGGGGEAERNPAKPTAAHLWTIAGGRQVLELPALIAPSTAEDSPTIQDLWLGRAHHPEIEARITGTIGLALMTLGRGGDTEAENLWRKRTPALRNAS